MPRKNIYSKELLEPIVKKSKSIADILRNLNLVLKGGNYKTIKRYLIKYHIDFSHFTGQGWSKGLSKEISEKLMKRSIQNSKHTIETSMIEGVYLQRKVLERFFNQLNKPYVCEECNIYTWNNKKIILHIDHINGNNTDNRIENLRYLCPNCHSQTKNYCAKNKHSYKNEFFCQPLVSFPKIKEPEKYFNYIENKILPSCKICNKECKFYNYKYCSYECRNIGTRKVKLTNEEIYNILKNNHFNYRKTGKEIGMSDNGIKKRIKSLVGTAGLEPAM